MTPSTATPAPGPAGASAVERRLGRLAGSDAIVRGLAIDHRDSFVAALRRKGVEPDRGLITGLKKALLVGVADLASAVMIDHDYGGAAIDAGLVPPPAGLVMPLEAQGYEVVRAGHRTTLMADFDPRRAATRYAADACKLLLPYRAGDEAAGWQEDVAARAIDAAHAEGLPLVLEPVVPRRDDEPLDRFDQAYRDLVLQAVARLRTLRPDVLKLPFPEAPGVALRQPDRAAESCRSVTAACDGVPWLLLGGSAGFEEVEAQTGLALAAGAWGFLVGRSVWSPALDADAARRDEAIRSIVRPAFERLSAVAARHRPDRRLRPTAVDHTGSVPGT